MLTPRAPVLNCKSKSRKRVVRAHGGRINEIFTNPWEPFDDGSFIKCKFSFLLS